MKTQVVILSIVEGDCEGWAFLATRKTGFGAYWHHRQSLGRLGMPGSEESSYSSFAPPALRNEYRSFLQRWEPFGSPDVFHLAMVELVDMLHSAKN